MNVWYNRFFVRQDYEFAREFMAAYLSLLTKIDLEEKDENKKFNFFKELIHLEGIFLDITDRTQAHPRVPSATEERKGVLGNFLKSLGFGNRKIIWKYSEVFNFKAYCESNWFVSTLEMYDEHYKDMHHTKRMYLARRINILEYFLKRLDIYNRIEATQHHKYFKGIDMNKYVEKMRQIFNKLPVMTTEGEFDN